MYRCSLDDRHRCCLGNIARLSKCSFASLSLTAELCTKSLYRRDHRLVFITI